ncbi:MAG: ATP-binding protein [Candidatus Eisenbacteria bacterium]|nr:ATP-binding protein [Candidatus Eisenbacteria bacterium]
MRTTIEQFEQWLREKHEGNLEFKEAKNQFDTTKLMKYCVAIANEGGGKLVLGVTDKKPREVVGSQAFENLEDIQRRIFEKLRFRVETEKIPHPSGRVVVFHIPSRPTGTAYHIDGAYLMRSTEETVPMSEDRLRAIFNEGRPSWLSEIALRRASSDDVIRSLDTHSYFDLLNLAYPASRERVLERFESERFITSHYDSYDVTNLGAILFAKDLKLFESLHRKAPRVIVYEGIGKTKTKSDKPGVKGYAVGFEGLIDYIGSQLPSNEVIGKALRETVQMYPEIVIRELVANALIHQDFNESGTSVMIEIYNDRIEISNPGKPFIPPERFIDEYQSRNDRLADVMRRLGICEEKGSGIDKVVESVELFQLPAPDFRVGEKHTLVLIFAHKEFDEMEMKDKVRACYQHCCLRCVMNQKMTNQSLRGRFKLSAIKADAASRVIRETLEAGLIRLEDPESSSKRYAKYIPFWA